MNLGYFLLGIGCSSKGVLHGLGAKRVVGVPILISARMDVMEVIGIGHGFGFFFGWSVFSSLVWE